ncbi:unnamed protein product [Strongylus vulgaris]|uniref:Aminotransferase class V domain-containing protein n=1 Tax=Strongylus vulgaris TaxID=40348 RepID=A0A3P7LQ57_STRVU|nr:unnamed protein product [Strongylus vulgaris]
MCRKLLLFYKAIAVWDYASAAPYIDINVNGTQPVDAVFFSGHKFIGGVSTPDAEYREEGGTPDSVGIIRLALAVKLKRAVGERAIIALEKHKTK